MSDERLLALLERFRAAHEAGERPDPADYLAQAGADADDLAAILDRYLAEHPPPPAAALVDALAADPRFAAPGWPALLRSAREERRLLRRDVARRVAEALGARGAAQERVAEHLHALGAGTLSPAPVSPRVVAALDAVLGGVGEALERTRLVFTPPRPSAAFLRAEQGEAAALPPAEGEPVDAARDDAVAAVDRLFLGERTG